MAAKKQRIVGLYFNDGCVLSRDRIAVSGKLKGVDPDEVTFSRCFGYNARSPLAGGKPRWGYGDYPGWNVVSTCLLTTDSYAQDPATGGLSVILSARGNLRMGGIGVPEERQKIADVDGYGAVKQVRQIGETLYVCGMQGQVYRREAKGWAHIDRGILDPEISPTALHLNGVDGTSDRNIYACGFGGAIVEYDGTRWHRHSPPTNRHLERVLCFGGSVYFCGNKGTFFRMTNGGFEDFSIRSDDHFWGMAEFEGKVYLATLKGLFAFDGSRVRPLRTGLEPEIGGYRLDARDGQLWSFGVDDLAWFDGQKWTRLKHPDNK